jgi:hypothetical protein
VRGAISTFARLADVESGLARLAADLASGAWERRHGHLRARDAFDLGYRLVVAERRPYTIAERRSSTIAERR